MKLAMLARKQREFDQYARESELAKGIIDAEVVSDESIAKTIVVEERKRLRIMKAT